MLRSFSGVLLCACLGLAAGPPQKAFPYSYEQHDFPNGLRLIAIPDDYPNVVSLYIVVQTGSRNEVEPGKSGFAHLFEHMMFRGTKEYPTAKYEAVLNGAGAASNAYTSDDHTAYHTTFSKEDFERILAMEADRFQHLEYTPDTIRTESRAVLGEYNKNSANPMQKLREALRDTAFDRSTYKHTTMGYLRDVEDMPNQYEYSRQFFDRYYRPEFTTIVVVGDVSPEQARTLTGKYWSGWQRGGFRPKIPIEPRHKAPREKQVSWASPTLPLMAIAFQAPAYSDTAKDAAALDLLAWVGFSQNSDLYQKLVIKEQRVDMLSVESPDQLDPYLFGVWARVKNAGDVDAVRGEILAAIDGFKRTPVSGERLEAVKKHARYSFALRMDNSEAIAGIVAEYVALRRTPETINRLYKLYAAVTPKDLQNAARKYFVESGRIIATLTGGQDR
jgi:zinc protease